MGIICILLGIIIFIGFTGLGVVVSNLVISFKNVLAASLVQLATVPNTTITISIVAVFGFIGLMIGLNYIMHGLTYNKVCKIARRRRRREG